MTEIHLYAYPSGMSAVRGEPPVITFSVRQPNAFSINDHVELEVQWPPGESFPFEQSDDPRANEWELILRPVKRD